MIGWPRWQAGKAREVPGGTSAGISSPAIHFTIEETMQDRIYAVTDKTTFNTRLVVAQSPAQAMRHVANDLFEVKAASAALVGKLMSGGAKLEQSSQKEEKADLPMAA